MASDIKSQFALLTAPGAAYEMEQVEVFGRQCRSFKNAPPTLRALFEEARSDAEFFIYLDERLTFEQCWQHACTLAHIMVNDYGVQKGDRVAISMRNYPEWVISFMAATSIGAIACALNALWQSDDIAHALGDATPKVLVIDQERVNRMPHDGLPDAMQIIAVRSDTIPDALAAKTSHWHSLMATIDKDTMPPVDMHPNDDALMLYTSGSTGHPKGAISCHRNVLNALLSWELDMQAALGNGLVNLPTQDRQAATLLGVPLVHVTGSHAVFLSSYRAQRRCVSMYKWDVAEAVRLIETEQITQFVAPAAMTGDLADYAVENDCNISSLQVVGGGGAPRAPEQVARIKSDIDSRPNTGWGMTETNAIGTAIIGEDYLERPASSGRASAVLDIRIVDEHGNVLPAGERGELQICGGSIIRGYWNRPDANAETFDGDWLRTGDVAYLDEDGFVFIVDRIKDLVIRGGENIGCGAVEAALLEYPDIVEASVYGVPDDRLGEEVGATIFCENEIDRAALDGFLRARLAHFEVPRYLQIETQPLPRTASGKILKRELRAAAIDRLGA